MTAVVAAGAAPVLPLCVWPLAVSCVPRPDQPDDLRGIVPGSGSVPEGPPGAPPALQQLRGHEPPAVLHAGP